MHGQILKLVTVTSPWNFRQTFSGYKSKFKFVFLICIGLSTVLEALKLNSCE